MTASRIYQNNACLVSTGSPFGVMIGMSIPQTVESRKKEMTKEVWKHIKGFERSYAVSNMGRVQSLSRIIIRSNGTRLTIKGRILKAYPNPNTGHLCVRLGIGKFHRVHRLVLRAFKGNPKLGHEGLHENHDPSDNRLANLTWGTRHRNMQMAYDAGLNRQACPCRAHFVDGVSFDFVSCAEAARFIGTREGTVLRAMRGAWMLRDSGIFIESLE